VKHINPYLVDGPDVLLFDRSSPICDVPSVGIGNKPIDDGNYLFTEEERAEFTRVEPGAEKYFRPWVGSDEFINGWKRYCLWLGDAAPEDLRSMPEVMKRIENVRRFRLASRSASTRNLAATPTRFHVENMPESSFVVIPETSSEKREYIPIGFMAPEVFCSNAVKIVSNATLYHFGVLTSGMHMAWVRHVCGRMKSDYRYSIGIVYNNFPWPETTDAGRTTIEVAAREVLDARAAFPDSSLADLYDPRTMPARLRKAHASLDRAVEKAYRRKFDSDADRVAFLLGQYRTLVDRPAG
jgi:hypothetical protein